MIILYGLGILSLLLLVATIASVIWSDIKFQRQLEKNRLDMMHWRWWLGRE